MDRGEGGGAGGGGWDAQGGGEAGGGGEGGGGGGDRGVLPGVEGVCGEIEDYGVLLRRIIVLLRDTSIRNTGMNDGRSGLRSKMVGRITFKGATTCSLPCFSIKGLPLQTY